LCKAFKANYPKAAMNRASKNKSVFDEVGKKLGISSSLIEKYYYKIDKLCKNSN
jgi:predicted solute-binding protein